MRGPNLDEIEGNLDGLDPLEDLVTFADARGAGDSLLDQRDRLQGANARLTAELALAHDEIADLREEVAELLDEIEDRVDRS